MLQAIKRLIKRITIKLIRAVRKLFTTNTTASVATKTKKEEAMKNNRNHSRIRNLLQSPVLP